MAEQLKPEQKPEEPKPTDGEIIAGQINEETKKIVGKSFESSTSPIFSVNKPNQTEAEKKESEEFSQRIVAQIQKGTKQ